LASAKLALRFSQNGNGRFLPLSPFGTLSAIYLACSGNGSPSGSGKKKMTYVNLSQIATSVLAALVTSTIFISAAVGPVGQFI
jgi:hypothetical protein